MENAMFCFYAAQKRSWARSLENLEFWYEHWQGYMTSMETKGNFGANPVFPLNYDNIQGQHFKEHTASALQRLLT